MDEKQDNRNTASGEPSTAYHDALYSQAPSSGRTQYGYNLAQCYARASEPEECEPAPAVKKRRLGGIVAVISALLFALLVLATLQIGSLFLASRAEAADETAPSREIYEDLATLTETGDTDLALAVASDAELAELSAEEIYDVACGCTVGITIPGYATNIFGQSGPSAVTGSGIVLSEDGYILTNFHVIEDAYDKGAPIVVITYDEREYPAEVVGVETDSDLAVLRVEAEGLIPVQMGDSDALRVGQTIYAVGNPLGELTYTMTSGIISALNRQVTTDVNVTVNMFQIDAAVNSGNSGGPVFNVYGQVIGVVTAKYSQYGMEGLGFAIPIVDACRIASDLVEKGYVSGKAYLGLNTATVSPSVARYYDMVQGVYIYSVEEGSCSEAAGLRTGDIITAVDGEPVRTSSELAKTVKLYCAGDSAELTVFRDDTYITVTVVFDEELPAEAMTEAPAAGASSGDLIVREG